jgi:alkylation response protein AidB-like acyl-CoA dehydrogenase
MTVTSSSAASDTDLPTADEQLVIDLCDKLLAEHDPATTPATEFMGAQYDLGLAWVSFPEGLGGLGLSPKLQKIVNDRLLKAHAPLAAARNIIGYGMGGPTLLECGTREQQEKLLRPLAACEDIWCQLFSEPGAGSDVAGLACKAERDGDEWIINGQKVWTTLAHVARWGMLVARTDPDQPKHKGLTYFILDMQAPGVEVRPLRQITGEAEFNEVYLTDVRIPDSIRVGEVGEGWRVALTTLMNERVAIGGGIPPRGGGMIAEAVRIWRETGASDPARRDELMRLWVRAEVLRLTNIRASQLRSAGTPGPEGSVGKMASADFNKDLTSFCLDLMGPEGMLYRDYTMKRPTTALMFEYPQKAFLRTRANSIEGGTSEVMRNILGERVLGLPGDVRDDKDQPWIDVPRS